MTDEQRKKMLESKKGKSDTKSDRNVKKTVGTGLNDHMGTNYVLRAGRTGLNNARLNAEEDEVREIKWIPLDDLDSYDFAWNQVESIKRIFGNYIE